MWESPRRLFLQNQPPPVPEPPPRQQDHQTERHSEPPKERGLKSRPTHSTASSRGLNLGRALGRRQGLFDSSAVSSTISDNRTGDSKSHFLAALDRDRWRSLSSIRNVGMPSYAQCSDLGSLWISNLYRYLAIDIWRWQEPSAAGIRCEEYILSRRIRAICYSAERAGRYP